MSYPSRNPRALEISLRFRREPLESRLFLPPGRGVKWTTSRKSGGAVQQINALGLGLRTGEGILNRLRLGGLAFHHIGVACRDLDVDEKQFIPLGYEREGPDFFDPIQGVHGRFLVGAGPRLELLRNHESSGVLSTWLKNRTKFYHLAYEAGDLAASGADLESQGAKQVVAPVPAVAFGGRKITFYMLANFALIELISRTLD